MINNTTLIIELLTPAGIGFALGCFYYGGLWFTVNHVVHWRQPALGMLLSLLLRLLAVGIGLYLLAGDDWQRYAAALLGLLLARWWWIRRIKPQEIA